MRYYLENGFVEGSCDEISNFIKLVSKDAKNRLAISSQRNNKSKEYKYFSNKKWKRWSDFELETLKKEANYGTPIHSICKMLGRNFNSVKSQAYKKFGYKFSKGKFIRGSD